MAAVDYQFLTIFGCVGLYVGVSDSELTQFYYIEFQMVIMRHAWILNWCKHLYLYLYLYIYIYIYIMYIVAIHIIYALYLYIIYI